jgi:hypothetical protein
MVAGAPFQVENITNAARQDKILNHARSHMASGTMQYPL